MRGKKAIATVLATALTLSFGLTATGCGDKNKGVDGKTTVRISRWALEWEKDVFRNWTAEFTAANPDIAIEWEFTPYTSHFDRLRTDLLSSKAADIIFVNNWGWEPYSDIEIFEDLGSVTALADTFDSLIDAAQNALTQGNKVVGMPIGMVSRVPVVNTADFKTANVQVPYERRTSFTGTELVELLGNVADASGRDMGINITLTDALTLFLASLDSPIVTENNTIGCNTAAGVKAVKEFVDFALSGRVVPLAQNQSGSYGSPDTAIMTGRVVAGYTNPGGYISLLDAGYSLAAIPSLKASDGADTILADFNTLVMPKFSKVKDEAYRVMNWMLSKEAQLKYAKFADLPTSEVAFDEVMTDTETWDPTLYSAFGVGVDNIYVAPAMSTDFQTLLGGALKNLLDGVYTPAQFCQKLADDGPKYL